MKISHKLFFGFSAVIAVFCVVGYYSIHTSQEMLEEAISRKSTVMARTLMSDIDKLVYSKVVEYRAYVQSPDVQRVLQQSNIEFSRRENIEQYIEKADSEWTSVPKEEITGFMEHLINNDLSEDLKRRIEFYGQEYDCHLIGEIFVTNKYGANIAQSGKTTDYRQNDEVWWQEAKQKGLYVSDFEYDESSDTYCVGLAIKIDDARGDFAGVIKVVFDVRMVTEIIDFAKAASKYRSSQIYLLNHKGRILYCTEPETGERLASESFFCASQANGAATVHSYRKDGKLCSYFVSQGYGKYKGLGWLTLVEHDEKEVLSSVFELRDRVLFAIIATITASGLLGFLATKSVTQSIGKLRQAVAKIGRGDFDADVDISSGGSELRELASAFKNMACGLKSTTTSLNNLNREVEQRKQTEICLENQAKFIRVALDSLDHPFYVVNTDYTIALSNEAGKEKGIAEGKFCYEATHNREQPCHAEGCPLRQVIETKKPVTFEHIHYDDTGNKNIVEVHGDPIFDNDGNVIQMVEYAIDISEHKKMEEHQRDLLKQMESANQELKDFAYIISHDLKAPLRGIKTIAGWLSDDYADKLDENGKEQLKLLVSRVDRMHNLIDGVLQYSRIGRVREQEVRADLNELVTEAIDTVSAPANIKVTVENNLPEITCERTRIGQVFQNLIDNAVKFMDKPDGQVKIRCGDQDDFWEFSVSDNGPGIEEKYFEHIFKIFQTLSTKDDYEGTGVGLTLVKKIVELYGGRVWVQSKVGEGSTFYFTLSKQKSEVKDGMIPAATC